MVFEELSELAAIQAENLTTDSTFEQMQRQVNINITFFNEIRGIDFVILRV